MTRRYMPLGTDFETFCKTFKELIKKMLLGLLLKKQQEMLDVKNQRAAAAVTIRILRFTNE